MNKFLKKEWEDTRIPDEVYLRGRNRAWMALHESRTKKAYKYVYATAGVLLILGLVFLFQTPDQEPQLTDLKLDPLPLLIDDPFEALTPPPLGHPPEERVTHPTQEPVPAPEEVELPMRVEARQGRPDIDIATPREVIVEFRLPKTGVRMIWIIKNRGDS